MATTNYNSAQRNPLFPPTFFDDPDTIAQIAGVENSAVPTGPTPATPGGVVPKSFTEYAADPINAGKIPPAVPANTPMPSLVAKAVNAAASAPAPAALPVPSDFPPPFSPDIQGSPEAQGAVSSGPGLMTKAADKGLSAPAPATATPAATSITQPQAPSGPLSKADFLAQNPAKIPGAPYVPQGKKLALTGLFAALDNAGAFLDHGTPSVGPGLIRNVQALQEYNANLPQTQQQAENAAYDEYLKNYGAVRSNTLSPVTTIGPDGRAITTYVDPKTQSTLLGAGVHAGATIAAAHIHADSAQAIEQMKLQVAQGKVARLVPIQDETGKPVMGAYNQYGQLVNTIDNAVIPSLLPKNSSTVDIKEDGNGGYVFIPKTTTTVPVLPGAPHATSAPAPRQPGVPPTKTNQTPGSGVLSAANGSVDQSVSATAPAPNAPHNAPAARKPGTPPGAARPVLDASGHQVGGIKSTEQGYAFDPKTNENVLVSRADAANSGLQNFRPATGKMIEDDTRLNNQLADVARKTSYYNKAVSDPKITDQDRNEIGNIIREDKLKAGLFGIEIPVDQANQYMKAYHIGNLSDEAARALAAYYNARESMSGYNKVLTGSSRNNEKQLQLSLDALPNPVMPPKFINEAYRQFEENIHIAAQGLPRIPGVVPARELLNGMSPTAATQPNQPPSAAAPGGNYLPWFKPAQK